MATKVEVLSIKVSTEEKEFIKREAERQDVSVSKLLYRVIKKEFFDKATAPNKGGRIIDQID